jgi:hypothetical protein
LETSANSVTCVDREINAVQWIVYDALYAYRQEMIRLGKPNNEFKDAAPV